MTAFQIQVARLFFSLPESEGFLLAGAGALLAQGLTHRSTEDLDFFGGQGEVSISAAADALRSAAEDRGWESAVIRKFDTFCRLEISAAERLVVDLAVDSPPVRAPRITVLGPPFDPVELAARKMLALFGRAEPRDFADVFQLAQRFGKEPLLAGAAELDRGFHREILAQILRSLAHIEDARLPVGLTRVPELRAFFAAWADELDGA
ncbi:nucleotidyl transferase AbiEii/AbiGii toxin family protein [Actinomadura alba]|uniref:Nucleotidyl transferase AbiEii/AbiGii toxin family protein n=1 Tax=Actinomadura alba TaxID=406431 RepID=A0ABR7LME9_9ACTN|nr:nucleotidyl transferase AbiEii/AbiGii toxin family protein [Actinomadura alba]